VGSSFFEFGRTDESAGDSRAAGWGLTTLQLV
jgi:hypothetical protein